MFEPIVTLDEESLRADLGELVRKAVEEMLDGLLEEAADDLIGAGRRGRTADREAYRAGRCERKPATTAGEVAIRMPRLKGVRFARAVIERCRRREASVGEAMIEMRLAGVSTRRIEDVSEMLWGSSVSAATVSDLNEKGARRGRWARPHEAQGGRRGRPRGPLRDAGARAAPRRAPEPHTREQRRRAPEPGDPQAHPRGLDLP